MGRILIGKVTHPLKDNLETTEPGQGSLDAHQGKTLKGLIDSLGLSVGDLTTLQTTDKDSLVNAINNLANAVSTLNSKIIDTGYVKTYDLPLPVGEMCLVYGTVAGFYCASRTSGIICLNMYKATDEIQYTVNNNERTVTFSAKDGSNIRLIVIRP